MGINLLCTDRPGINHVIFEPLQAISIAGHLNNLRIVRTPLKCSAYIGTSDSSIQGKNLVCCQEFVHKFTFYFKENASALRFHSHQLNGKESLTVENTFFGKGSSIYLTYP